MKHIYIYISLVYILPEKPGGFLWSGDAETAPGHPGCPCHSPRGGGVARWRCRRWHGDLPTLGGTVAFGIAEGLKFQILLVISIYIYIYMYVYIYIVG